MPIRNKLPSSSARNRFARLGLESLEDRTVLSSTTTSVPVDAVSSTGTSYSPSDILVQFKSAPQAVLSGTSIGQQFSLVANLYEVKLSSGVSVSQALAAYKANANVKFAEPDYSISSTSVPSNSNIAQQWALQAMNVEQAWNVTEGSRSMIVAVDDTGIDYDDPDLYSNIWINQAEIPASRLKNLVDVYHDGYISMRDLNSPVNQGPGKIEDLNHDGYIDAGDLLQTMKLNAQGQDTGLGGWINPNVTDAADGFVGDLIGWNFSADNDQPLDSNGHGTHVAGIIAGTGTDGGTIGIAPNVQLMPIEFLDVNGNGTVSQFISGLDYEVAHGAKISNNSWNGADPSQALTDAINNAQAHGVIFVTAAGNESSDNDTTPDYPASLTENNVVAVAATDQQNNLASFSNYGAKSVALAAPGVNILSTLPGGSYGPKSGTSMATPMVAGVLALVWSEHPTWTYTQVISQVESTVTPVAGLKGKVATGGVVNAAAAVGAVSASSTPAIVLSATPSGPSTNTLSTIQLTFDRGISPTSFTSSDISLLGPKGQIAVSSVSVIASSSDRTFNINFPTQTAAGTYTLYVGSSALDLSGNPISRYQTQFTLAAVTSVPPKTTVVSSKGMGSTAYNLSSIQLTFSQAINPSTFTASDLTLEGPSGSVAVTSVTAVSGSNDCTFTVGFATQTAPGTYTLYVGSAAKDSAGNAIGTYQGQYKVTAAPVVTHVISSTSSGPTAYSLSTIQLTFSQGVSPSSFTAADLTLEGPSAKVAITSVAAVAGSNDCTFNVGFATQTTPGTYTLYVGSAAKDNAGNAIGTYQGQYKVTAAPVPTHVVSSTSSGPTAYSLSTIQLTFSQGVSPSSFTAADLTLEGPSAKVAITSVAAVAGTNDCTFTVSFATQTTPGTYTLYVGSAAKDNAGNAIGTYQGQYKVTAAPTPTHVTSSTSSGPTAYSLSTIQLTFSQGVSPSSFTAADLTLEGPSAKVAITSVAAVAGTNDCTFTVGFATQTTPGTYTLYVGSAAKDNAGNAIGTYQGQYTVAAAPTPTHVVSSTASGPSANTLSSIQLTFSQGVSPSSFTASDLTLLGPNGKIAVTGVTAVASSSDRTFNVTFATQTAAGTYTLYVGTSAVDLSGKAIASSQAQFTIAAATKTSPTISSFSSTTPVSIPASGRGVSQLKISNSLTIGHITVQINVQYSHIGDLYIHLQAPDGTNIVLSQQMGGSAANFPNTTFDDNASKSMAFSAGPYTGSYQPLTPLSYLNGKNTQGTWLLWVENSGTSTGTLTGFTLNITPAS